MKQDKTMWFKDFKDFLDAEEVQVPAEVSQRILKYVRGELNPPIYKVFLKLLIVHIPVAFLSLLICDQFGMGPFQKNFSLMQYFMHFGSSVCMFLCGLFFISSSMLVSSVILLPEELRMLKKKSYIHSLFLSLFSIGSFLIFGAQITLSIGFLWILGATIGGIFSSELVYFLRLRKFKA